MGISRVSAIQSVNSLGRIALGITSRKIVKRIEIISSYVVADSSTKHMSAKLLSVTSSPFISTVIPDSNAATNVEKSHSKRMSSKQASISSASEHSSTGGTGSSSTTTVLLLLFIHTNLNPLFLST